MQDSPVVAAPAVVEPPSPGDTVPIPTPEQEQACTSDAFRLCSSEIPNVDRVTACMVAKKSQLSPPCRAQFRPDPAPSQATTAPAPDTSKSMVSNN